jgi:hypothetical protein
MIGFCDFALLGPRGRKQQALGGWETMDGKLASFACVISASKDDLIEYWEWQVSQNGL